MATSAQYVDSVWYSITKGKPQPAAELWRVAVQSTLNRALQRLADRVAADEALHSLLVNQYPLTLSGGEIAINTLSPTLLLSEPARTHWYITMTGVRFPLKYLPHRRDLDNPPPTSDYYFYTVFDNALVVRDSTGQVPTEVDVQLFGNYVPLINDPAFNGELMDNLVDVGVALVLESGTLGEVIRQAETPTGVAPVAPPTEAAA